ncbi:zinc finger protein 91-like [Alosa sapidissima]|uniref:zinc finger protein 91-like n=1 Tax=Alosa sapidissima TaxID=34773 RepID=UPI001C0855A0|nr:zinc finger protein 91-like [Alosa sapidissima]
MEGHDSYECEVCNKRFTLKSNLTRHMKLHDPKQHACDVCGKSFSTKPQLDLHLKQHQYPRIPMYRQGEARMMCTVAAKAEAGNPNKKVDPTWLDPVKAEAAAKKAGGEMWRGQLVMTHLQQIPLVSQQADLIHQRPVQEDCRQSEGRPGRGQPRHPAAQHKRQVHQQLFQEGGEDGQLQGNGQAKSEDSSECSVRPTNA